MVPQRRLLWSIPALSFAIVLGTSAPASSQGKSDTRPASKPASDTRPANDRKPLAAGDPAPAFSVKDHTGKVRTLADYKGKRVLLFFYPKADTPG